MVAAVAETGIWTAAAVVAVILRAAAVAKWSRYSATVYLVA